MGMLLVKFLPYIWPLIKEFLEGKKDHPYFKDGIRAKSKAKIVSFILLVGLLVIGNWAYDLHVTNEELLKKVEAQSKAPLVKEATYSRTELDLLLCQRDTQELKIKLAETQTELVQYQAKIRQCTTELEWERLDRIEPTKSSPEKPKPKIGEEAQKKLDSLKKGESNNASH